MAIDTMQAQQSQTSSLESTSSRDFERQAASIRDSSPSLRSQNLRETTPSTSLSNHSSQPRTRSRSPLNLHVGGKSHPSLSCSPPAAAENAGFEPTITRNYTPSTSPATKRTASGQVKVGAKVNSTSPPRIKEYGHSRNSSTASKASQVSELSHELRTRLSYAMFKVQNGWQSYNLNELEAMTLIRSSPQSDLSQMQHDAVSPASRTAHQYSLNGEQHATPVSPQSAYNPILQKAFAQPPPSHRQLTDKRSPQHSPYRGPSLAPPVDILPRNSRRSIQPTGLNIANIHVNGANHAFSPASSSYDPTTPSKRRPTSALRTPSQKADAEKDAVETLMFMSSPNKPGYPRSALHASNTSPVPNSTAAFSPTQRADFTSGWEDARMSSGSRRAPGRLTTTAEIDRVLDELPDRYSSSEEE